MFAIFLDYDGVAVGVFGDGACLLEVFFGGGDALLRFEGGGEFGVGFWCGHDSSRKDNTLRTLVLVKVRGRTSSEDDEMYNKEKDGGK